MDKLTSQFQKALADAQSLALGRDHQFLEPLHVLGAMLAQDGAGVGTLLAHAGVAVDRLRTELGRALERLPQVQGVGGDVQPSQALMRALNLAEKYAQQRGDEYIASE
ncbi:MAG TPA: Clp protease N-terminal domain-containing protein, partial [Immundisolibacter sp.]